MSTQPTDVLVKRARKAALADWGGRDPSNLFNELADALEAARTPPPCAGDDVERGIQAIAAASDYELRADLCEKYARAVIAALGTTPSIVGEEQLQRENEWNEQRWIEEQEDWRRRCEEEGGQ